MQRLHFNRCFALNWSMALAAAGLASSCPLWAADFNAATKAGGGPPPSKNATAPDAPPQTADAGSGASGGSPKLLKPTFLNRLERLLPNSQPKAQAPAPVAPSPIANRPVKAAPATPPASNVRQSAATQQVDAKAAPEVLAQPNVLPPAAAAAPPPQAKVSKAAAAEPQPLSEEDQTKVEMIRYLATLGCEACYPETESALLVFLGEENEQVRFEAARALGELAGRPCCWCNAATCASEEGLKRLEDVGYGRRENGRFKERSLRVRKLARLAARSASERPTAPQVIETAPAGSEQPIAEKMADNGSAESSAAERDGATRGSDDAAGDVAGRGTEMKLEESAEGETKLAASERAQSLGQTNELIFDKSPAAPAKAATENSAERKASSANDAAAALAADFAPPSVPTSSLPEAEEMADETRDGDVAAQAEPSTREVAAPPDLAAALAKSARSQAAPVVSPQESPTDSVPSAAPAPSTMNTVAAPRVFDSAPSDRANARVTAPAQLPIVQSPPSSVAGGKPSSRRAPSADEAPPEVPPMNLESEQQMAITRPAAPSLPASSPMTTVQIDDAPRGLESRDQPPSEPLPQPGRLKSKPADPARLGLTTQPELKPALREVMAEINGEKITSDEILPTVEATLKSRGARLDPASLEELRQDLVAAELRRAIDRKLLCQMARSQNEKGGVVSTSFAAKSAGASPAEEAKLADLWLQKAVPVDTNVTAADLEAFQRARGQRTIEPATVRCEIYTAPKTHYRDINQAQSVLEYAQARAAGERPPFPRDADPGAVQRQSYRLTNPQDVPAGPLAEAIFSLPLGGQSKVVEDSRGWHIVKVIERKRLAPSAETAKQNERLRAAVVAERRRQQEQVYLAQLRRQARVWTAVDNVMR